MQAIIDRLDAQFADPGYKYALLRREDWQTLKAAVLAQQANNKQSTPCHWCDGVHPMLNHAYCSNCGRKL